MPEPLAKLPAVNTAVRPVTPMEFTVCPFCLPPLPPVYGTTLFTLLAAVPAVRVPLLVAVLQFKEPMVPALADFNCPPNICENEQIGIKVNASKK